MKLPNLKRWACCGGYCSVSHTATCPVQSRFTEAIECTLVGIARVFADWAADPTATEHRCFHRLGWASNLGGWICTCDSIALVDVESQFCELLIAFSSLFWGQPRLGGDVWHARPGTHIEVRQ